jgi:hypothetical protein
MKLSLGFLWLSFVFLAKTFATVPPPTNLRTISDVSSIPHRVLQRSISPKFYKSLLISPIQGCVIVRAQLVGTHLSGLKVVHSELDGAYDSLALERAKAVTIAGYYALDKINQTGAVLVHLLVYQIADGTMALSFAHLDEPGGDQQEYYGCAALAVQKRDGKWVEITSVSSLQRKGLAVRTNRNSKYTMREIYFFAGFKPGK